MAAPSGALARTGERRYTRYLSKGIDQERKWLRTKEKGRKTAATDRFSVYEDTVSGPVARNVTHRATDTSKAPFEIWRGLTNAGKRSQKITTSVPTNLRIPREAQLTIDRAAKLSGKNRTEFMVEAAVAAAEDKLLDQAFIALDAETYAQFLDVLDKGPEPKGYKRLMNAPSPWGP